LKIAMKAKNRTLNWQNGEVAFLLMKVNEFDYYMGND
jgi:hypothetical protein